MSPDEQRSASYLVRVVATSGGGEPRITVQNLKTGEMRTFEAWNAFVAYAEGEPRPGVLK